MADPGLDGLPQGWTEAFVAVAIPCGTCGGEKGAPCPTCKGRGRRLEVTDVEIERFGLWVWTQVGGGVWKDRR